MTQPWIAHLTEPDCRARCFVAPEPWDGMSYLTGWDGFRRAEADGTACPACRTLPPRAMRPAPTEAELAAYHEEQLARDIETLQYGPAWP